MNQAIFVPKWTYNITIKTKYLFACSQCTKRSQIPNKKKSRDGSGGVTVRNFAVIVGRVTLPRWWNFECRKTQCKQKTDPTVFDFLPVVLQPRKCPTTAHFFALKLRSDDGDDGGVILYFVLFSSVCHRITPCDSHSAEATSRTC